MEKQNKEHIKPSKKLEEVMQKIEQTVAPASMTEEELKYAHFKWDIEKDMTKNG